MFVPKNIIIPKIRQLSLIALILFSSVYTSTASWQFGVGLGTGLSSIRKGAFQNDHSLQLAQSPQYSDPGIHAGLRWKWQKRFSSSLWIECGRLSFPVSYSMEGTVNTLPRHTPDYIDYRCTYLGSGLDLDWHFLEREFLALQTGIGLGWQQYLDTEEFTIYKDGQKTESRWIKPSEIPLFYRFSLGLEIKLNEHLSILNRAVYGYSSGSFFQPGFGNEGVPTHQFQFRFSLLYRL